MGINKFSHGIAEQLKHYVYIYSDPDTKQPFYVGKGMGNRVFAHLMQEGEKAKVQKIREIQNRGKEPLIEILVHGVDSDTALKVEAAAIDLIGIDNLLNEQRGHHSNSFGRKEVSALESIYNRKDLNKADISENVILIKINQLYRNGMSLFELYEVTRGFWKVGLSSANRAQYAFSVYFGTVIEVFTIEAWFEAGTTMYGIRTDFRDITEEESRLRREFVGRIAPEHIRLKYVNKSVSSFFSSGAQNPIMYVFKSNSHTED